MRQRELSMAALLPPRARLVDFNWSTRVTMASDKLASMNRTVVIVTRAAVSANAQSRRRGITQWARTGARPRRRGDAAVRPRTPRCRFFLRNSGPLVPRGGRARRGAQRGRASSAPRRADRPGAKVRRRLDVELEDGSMKELKMEMDKGKLASFVEQLTAVRDECDKARRAAAGPV